MGFAGGWDTDDLARICAECVKPLTEIETKRAAHSPSGQTFCDECLLEKVVTSDWDSAFLDMLNKKG